MLVINIYYRSVIICVKLIGFVVFKGKGKVILYFMNQIEGISVDCNEIVFIFNFKFYVFCYLKKKEKMEIIIFYI